MDDLRRELKEAFGRQQAQMHDVPGTGDRLLRGAAATRADTGRLWPSMAGVALVLLAAVAVATSVVVRGLHPRSVVTHGPSPTPTVRVTATPAPTALALPLQVPATTPVIVFRDPADENQVDGITWDGSTMGRLASGAQTGTGFAGNPQGSLFGAATEVRDRSGAVVATVPGPNKGFAATWADDGQHYCAMVSSISPVGVTAGVPTTLQVTQVGGGPRNVVQVGRAYEQASIGVAACSVAKDVAVVVQSGGQGIGTAQVWAVRLSSGRVLWTKAYQLGTDKTYEIHASIDGQYIAETTLAGSPMSAIATTIYSPAGAVLGHVNGEVQGFSWDATVAVVANYGGPVSVVRWRDGTTIWSSPASARFAEAQPEPGGSRIAVSVLNPDHPQTGGYPPVDIDVINADGKAVRILTNVLL